MLQSFHIALQSPPILSGPFPFQIRCGSLARQLLFYLLLLGCFGEPNPRTHSCKIPGAHTCGKRCRTLGTSKLSLAVYKVFGKNPQLSIMTPCIPAPVMIPIRKSGTRAATIIIRPSTSIVHEQRTSVKYTKWSTPLLRPDS